MKNKTDKEILELAAKAARHSGIQLLIVYWGSKELERYDFYLEKTRKLWNPSADDGDSRRLQEALKIDLVWNYIKECWNASGFHGAGWIEVDDSDPKRAVLLVAATIGENL